MGSPQADKADNHHQGRLVLFNMPILQRKKTPALDEARASAGQSPPMAGMVPKDSEFVQGTKITPTRSSKSIILCSCMILTKLPRWTTVVNMKICCVGDPDLMFEGPKTLAKEGKDVCFLCPDDFTAQGRKRSNLPAKFQHMLRRRQT